MNHVELHNELSSIFRRFTNRENDKIGMKNDEQAVNTAGKLINNCRNELASIYKGMPVEVPLLGISLEEAKSVTPIKKTGISELTSGLITIEDASNHELRQQFEELIKIGYCNFKKLKGKKTKVESYHIVGSKVYINLECMNGEKYPYQIKLDEVQKFLDDFDCAA